MFFYQKYLKSGKLFVDGGKKTWGPCSDHKSKTYKKLFFSIDIIPLNIKEGDRLCSSLPWQ